MHRVYDFYRYTDFCTGLEVRYHDENKKIEKRAKNEER